MIPFRHRIQIIIFAWVITAFVLLAMGVSTLWAVGGSYACFAVPFILAEWLTWKTK